MQIPTTPIDKIFIPPIKPIKIIKEAQPEVKPIKSFAKNIIKINKKDTAETSKPNKQIKISGNEEKLVKIFRPSFNFFKRLYEL